MEAADKIRNGIKENFGFTVCIGVSSNKLLAKMATELRKPECGGLRGIVVRCIAAPILRNIFRMLRARFGGRR